MEQIEVPKGSTSLTLPWGSIQLGGEVLAAAYCPEAELYLAAVSAASRDGPEEVVAVAADGAKLFRGSIPQEWRFYYFSPHIDYPLALVCNSPSERFDWFWGIDLKQGRLVSLNRAY